MREEDVNKNVFIYVYNWFIEKIIKEIIIKFLKMGFGIFVCLF